MAEKSELKVITIGGKGSALSSSSLHSIATANARVRIDTSAIDRLTNQPTSSTPLKKLPNPFISSLNHIELRASLAVLLNKLIHYSNSTAVRAFLVDSIAEKLNCFDCSDVFTCLDDIEVNDEECALIEKSAAELYGICAVLDHGAAGLAAAVDAAAALSCEAVKGNVSVFNSVDTGDGYVHKDRVSVANDLKVLLTGYKGKVESELILEIPVVHGKFREVSKALHSMSRVELNSGVEVAKNGAGKAVGITVNPVAVALWNLGKSSFCRAQMNLDTVGDETLKGFLIGMFENEIGRGDELNRAFKMVSDSLIEEKYGEFVHETYGLMEFVWKIVAWEAISALFSLEGEDLMSVLGVQDGKVNGMGVKGEKKGDKKKKKTVLGKGTSLIVQFIKDRLQVVGNQPGDYSEIVGKWVRGIQLFFDPRKQECDELVNKIKDIVETNESRRLPKLPKGTRDFAKEQMAIRERAFSIIIDVFKRHGATALDTPAFELRETLMGKYGEDSKLIYDLADQGGELCSLRYDLTVPFARYVAMNGITSFKRYQIAKVYRRDNPSKGRYREFYQCDFDIAGQYEEMGPDFEIVKILTELLDELNIGDYEVKLNHRKLLDGMLEICGVPPEKFRTICSSVDKLDKQSFDQVKKEMVEEKGLSIETADKIGSFVKERGFPKELLSKLKQEGSALLQNASSKRALDELEILFEALEQSRCIGKIVFDLSLARGLDYYTGVIFEAVFKGTTQVGSIAAGGRYDNLIGMFCKNQVPAVGVSLGIERVFTIMEQIQKDQNQTIRPSETQVLVSIFGDKSKLPLAAELVSELWGAKIKAEYLVSTRFTKHMDRAKDSMIPLMITVGEREVEKGIVRLKDLETTNEVEVVRSAVVEEVKRRLR